MSYSLATKPVHYHSSEPTLQNIEANYTGVIVPDDLRVKLPLRIAALEADEKVIMNAIDFCGFLPIVKVPDSVYVDEGDIVLYWKTGINGNVLAIIDEKYFHYFVRPETGDDIHYSNIEINEKSGYKLRPYLPPHPSRQNSGISTGTIRR
jgi:hypothetical protein